MIRPILGSVVQYYGRPYQVTAVDIPGEYGPGVEITPMSGGQPLNTTPDLDRGWDNPNVDGGSRPILTQLMFPA